MPELILTLRSLNLTLKLSYEDPKNELKATILSEDEQVVNAGTDLVTQEQLEGSISKIFRIGKKEDESNNLNEAALTEDEDVINTRNPSTDLAVDFVSTKFAHDDA